MGKKIIMIDAVIDLVLGFVLAAFPIDVIELVGAPPVVNTFYITMLGAVIIGIGIALLVEYFGGPNGPYGLGLAGAIAIDMCGAIALSLWLAFGDLALPERGQIILWTLVGILVFVSLLGLIAQLKK